MKLIPEILSKGRWFTRWWSFPRSTIWCFIITPKPRRFRTIIRVRVPTMEDRHGMYSDCVKRCHLKKGWLGNTMMCYWILHDLLSVGRKFFWAITQWIQIRNKLFTRSGSEHNIWRESFFRRWRLIDLNWDFVQHYYKFFSWTVSIKTAIHNGPINFNQFHISSNSGFVFDLTCFRIVRMWFWFHTVKM